MCEGTASLQHAVELLEALGPEGMSTDEEAPLEGQARIPDLPRRRKRATNVCWIHNHPWRSIEGTRMMRHIETVATAAVNLTRNNNSGQPRLYRQVPQALIPSRRETGEALAKSIRKGLPTNYYDWDKLRAWRETREGSWTLEEWLLPKPERLDALVIPAVAATT